jgi:hypothetical protein
MIYYLAFYDYEIRLHTHREDIDEDGLLGWCQLTYSVSNGWSCVSAVGQTHSLELGGNTQ